MIVRDRYNFKTASGAFISHYRTQLGWTLAYAEEAKVRRDIDFQIIEAGDRIVVIEFIKADRVIVGTFTADTGDRIGAPLKQQDIQKSSKGRYVVAAGRRYYIS